MWFMHKVAKLGNKGLDSVTYSIGANSQVCLSGLVNSVPILGLEVWTGTHKCSAEGVLQLPQPVIKAGDALRPCQEIERDFLIPMNVQEQVTAYFIHFLQ